MQLATSNLLAPNPALAGLLFPGVTPAPGQTAGPSPAPGNGGFPVAVPKSPAAAVTGTPGGVALAFLPPMASGAWHAAPPLVAGGDLMAEAGPDGTQVAMPCGVVFEEEIPELPVGTDARRLAEALANSGAVPLPLPVEPDLPLFVAECPAEQPSLETPTGGVTLDEPAFEPRRNSTLPPVPPFNTARELPPSNPDAAFALPGEEASSVTPSNSSPTLPTTPTQPSPNVDLAPDGSNRAWPQSERPPVAPMSAEESDALGQTNEIPTSKPTLPTSSVWSTASETTEPDIERLLAAASASTPLRRWENSAAAPGHIALDAVEDGNPLEKSFVSNDGKKVTRHREGDGIEAAKSLPVMPTSTLASPSAQPAVTASSALITGTEGLAERVEPQNMLALALDDVRTAHEAVEVVLRTADRLASLTHKSVKLEFAVAGERLDVRVELRANEVLTTFHTESAELRAALAQEWQGVAASTGHGERTLRLLPADFGSAGNDTSHASSGDAQSRQREAAQQQQLVTENAPYLARAGNGSRGGSRTVSVAPVADVSFAAPGTALHLHTLA